MKANIIRAFLVTGALSTLCAASGCVADRPSRNGVFNENQYIRKDFLVANGDGTASGLTIFNCGGYGSGRGWPGAVCQKDEVSRWRWAGCG